MRPRKLSASQSPSLSSSRHTPSDSKSNIRAQLGRTPTEDITNHQHHHHHHHHHNHNHSHPQQSDDDSALNLSNRMKRSHRHPLQMPCKYFRPNEENQDENRNTTESNSAEEIEQNEKPNVRELENNVNSTSASTSQQNDSTDNNHVEQKCKIRIKREFKIEANSNNETANENIGENVDNENTVAETKEHLKPLIASIKCE